MVLANSSTDIWMGDQPVSALPMQDIWKQSLQPTVYSERFTFRWEGSAQIYFSGLMRARRAAARGVDSLRILQMFLWCFNQGDECCPQPEHQAPPSYMWECHSMFPGCAPGCKSAPDPNSSDPGGCFLRPQVV